MKNIASKIIVHALTWACALEAWAPKMHEDGANRVCNSSRLGMAYALSG